MKKRLLSGLLCGTLTMSLLGGTAIPVLADDDQTITMWTVFTGSDGDILREIVKDYNESNEDGIKVDIVNYRYQWLDKPVVDQGIRMAGIKDIAAMKVTAVIGRGTKKDFIDISFLLHHLSLNEILDFYSTKYDDGSVFMAMKSLVYFDDAEKEPMPDMLINKSWEQVKEYILSKIS